MGCFTLGGGISINYTELIEQQKTKTYLKGVATKILQYMDKVRNESSFDSTRRWVLELLQNAVDLHHEGKSVDVKFTLTKDYVTFEHNAKLFRVSDILAILNQISSKTDGESIGRFGTGFMSTYQLSEKVSIQSALCDFGMDVKPFRVTIDRTGHTCEEILDSIERNYLELQEPCEVVADEFPTKFTYLFEDTLQYDVAKAGLEDLKNTAYFILAFNENLESITISGDMQSEYKVDQRTDSYCSFGDDLRVCLFKEQAFTLAAPVSLRLGSFLPIENVPKLFVMFPLVGSEDFPFPVVINSKGFRPNEPRSGITLVDNERSSDARVNREILDAAIKCFKDKVLLYFTNIYSILPACIMPAKKYRAEWSDDYVDSVYSRVTDSVCCTLFNGCTVFIKEHPQCSFDEQYDILRRFNSLLPEFVDMDVYNSVNHLNITTVDLEYLVTHLEDVISEVDIPMYTAFLEYLHKVPEWSKYLDSNDVPLWLDVSGHRRRSRDLDREESIISDNIIACFDAMFSPKYKVATLNRGITGDFVSRYITLRSNVSLMSNIQHELMARRDSDIELNSCLRRIVAIAGDETLHKLFSTLYTDTPELEHVELDNCNLIDSIYPLIKRSIFKVIRNCTGRTTTDFYNMLYQTLDKYEMTPDESIFPTRNDTVYRSGYVFVLKCDDELWNLALQYKDYHAVPWKEVLREGLELPKGYYFKELTTDMVASEIQKSLQQELRRVPLKDTASGFQLMCISVLSWIGAHDTDGKYFTAYATDDERAQLYTPKMIGDLMRQVRSLQEQRIHSEEQIAICTEFGIPIDNDTEFEEFTRKIGDIGENYCLELLKRYCEDNLGASFTPNGTGPGYDFVVRLWNVEHYIEVKTRVLTSIKNNTIDLSHEQACMALKHGSNYHILVVYLNKSLDVDHYQLYTDVVDCCKNNTLDYAMDKMFLSIRS